MLFNSLHFLVFFPVVVGLWFGLPPRWRLPLLLAASYYFYLSWRPIYGLLLAATTLLDYVSGRRMGALPDKKQRRPWLLLSLASNLGTLFVFKYFGFFWENARHLAEALQLPFTAPALALALPVGVSFYTFQSVAYVLDVYAGRLPAERNLGRFALFVAFWPQLVAGPIERGAHMLPQFRRPAPGFDYGRVASGLRLMAWGMFKKVVVADRLAGFVNPVFNHPQDHNALALTLAVLGFTAQIYADFSGYTDLARGAARVLGYDLSLNFRQPYFATSVGDFWRRWHMSLSGWFRDYLYIPLGGSRRGPVRTYFNLLTVFLVSGLWHGASWTFVVWGALHGLYVALETATAPARAALAIRLGLAARPRLLRALGTLATFVLVAFAWLFFRANNLADAWYISRHLLQGWGEVSWAEAGRTAGAFFGNYPPEAAVTIAALALVLAVDARLEWPRLAARWGRPPAPVRWAGYAALLLALALLGVFNNTQFIYFQF